MIARLKRNITLIYLNSSLTWVRFFIPVLALFYIAANVTIEQFSIILSIFALTTLILEVPSGVFADLFGKKNTLLIARTCYLVELIILAFSHGFWPFLIAKIISGIGVSLSSGTQSALLYDTLSRLGKEDRHKQYKGKQQMITSITMGATFIIGAYLFTINPKLPALVSIPFTLAAVVLTLFLEEPYKPNKHLAASKMGGHLIESITYIVRHKYVRYLVFYGLLFAATFSIALSYSSIYFQHLFIPIALIGVINLAAQLSGAYTAKQAEKIEQFLGERTTLRFLPFALLAILLLCSLMIPYVGFLFLIILVAIQSFYGVIIDNYINKHIETSHRATMLSINNLFANVATFILFPIIGVVAGIGIGLSFAALAFIFAAYMSFFFLIFHKTRFRA